MKIGILAFFAILLVSVAAEVNGVGWPLAPQDSVHPIGNNWGEYQYYGDNPYFHPGIDVMGTAGEPVYSVSHGWVKAWLTINGGLYWRLAVGDTTGSDSCDGWLYAHIDSSKDHVNVGDEVYPGDTIGYLVNWPGLFDHCHFARIRNAGTIWQSNWLFVENPLNLMVPNTDTCVPLFESIESLGTKFAFCEDNRSIYLDPDSLVGDVDVIARVTDEFGPPLPLAVWERLIPYRMQYSFRRYGEGDTTVASFLFGHALDWDNTVKVAAVYKDDSICNTQGNYDSRDYYFIVTNTDGDTILEESDTASSWETNSVYDGYYWFRVFAHDQYGNTTSDSMTVQLKHGDYACGDCNGDGRVTIADATYIVNYIYKSGPAPIGQGDVNLDDRITTADAVYIKNYIYQQGPPPCEPGGRSSSSGYAEVGLSSVSTGPRATEVSVLADFDVSVAAVHLEIAYDAETIEMLDPLATPRTKDLQLFYDLSSNPGYLALGIIDLEDFDYVKPGKGPILTLRFSTNHRNDDLKNLCLQDAMLIDSNACEMQVDIVNECVAFHGVLSGDRSTSFLPRAFELISSHPNPSQSGITICYGLPQASRITLAIYDLNGRLVKTLVDETKHAGYYRAYWKGGDSYGKAVPGGIYFVNIISESFKSTQKIILLR